MGNQWWRPPAKEPDLQMVISLRFGWIIFDDPFWFVGSYPFRCFPIYIMLSASKYVLYNISCIPAVGYSLWSSWSQHQKFGVPWYLPMTSATSTHPPTHRCNVRWRHSRTPMPLAAWPSPPCRQCCGPTCSSRWCCCWSLGKTWLGMVEVNVNYILGIRIGLW